MYIFGYIELELGEILKIKNGSDYKKFNIGNIPVYGSGGIINYIDTYIYDKESVLIPRKGSIGNLFYVDKPFWTVDTIFYTVIDKDVVIPKYLYYYLSKMNLKKLNTAGGVPSLTQTVLNKILIPLPPLEEQQKIVNILDRFDKLCNDISEGLPAEIEARQKQYDYYREKFERYKKILKNRENISPYMISKFISLCILLQSLDLIVDYDIKELYEYLMTVRSSTFLNEKERDEELLNVIFKLI